MNRGWRERFRDVMSSLRRLELLGSEAMPPQEEGDLVEVVVEGQGGQQVVEPEIPDVFLTEPPNIPVTNFDKDNYADHRTDLETLEADKPFFRDAFGLDIGNSIGSGHNATVYGGVIISDIIRKLYRFYGELDPSVTQLNGENVVWIQEGNESRKPYIERLLVGKRFAVKLLLGEERLARELELLSRLEHQNIIDIYHVGTISGPVLLSTWPHRSVRIYIFMEMADHGSLEGFLQSYTQPFTEQMCISFTNQVIDGLTYLQSLNMVHMSLRPDNILVFNGNAKHRYVLKIADFGNSQVIEGFFSVVNDFQRDMVGLAEIFRFYDKLDPYSTLHNAMVVIRNQLRDQKFHDCVELRNYLNQYYPNFFTEGISPYIPI